MAHEIYILNQCSESTHARRACRTIEARESTRTETNCVAETGQSSSPEGWQWQHLRQGFLVFSEFAQHIGGSDEVRVVVEDTLQSGYVPD